jgi:hypothetical protein
MATLFRPELTEERIEEVQEAIAQNPGLTRTQLSHLICELWDWRSPNGRHKDISCRDMLRGLDKAGKIKLPPPKKASLRSGQRNAIAHLAHDTSPIACRLNDLLPLQIQIAKGKEETAEFKSCIDQFHYLGFDRTVGENMKYILRANSGRAVSCLLFGSAAWSCRDRDMHIGWDKLHRRENLHLLTNNTRFLIPQWVRVPHLASHSLSLVLHRLSGDWEAAYGHPLLAVETFVDISRFRGVCYRAANFIYVGRTTGRGRDGGHHHAILPKKDIYLYPLDKQFRQKLRGETQ